MAPLQTPTDGSRLRSEYNQETLQRDTEDWKEHQGDGKRGTFKSSSLRCPTKRISSTNRWQIPAKHKKSTSKHPSVWLYCLVTLLTGTYCQTLGLVAVGASAETNFRDTGRGEWAVNTAKNFYVFNYKEQDGGNYFVKAYDIAGAVIGSITRPGDTADGITMLTSTRFVVAPKTNYNYLTLDAQTITGTSVSFVINSGRTSTATHSSELTRQVLAEPNTNIVYIAREKIILITFVRLDLIVVKVSTASSSYSAIATYTENLSNLYSVNCLEHVDDPSLLIAGGGLLVANFYSVITKSSMASTINRSFISQISCAKVEPLDTTLVYFGSIDNKVSKVILSTGSVQFQTSNPNPIAGIVRPSGYNYLLGTSMNGSAVIRVYQTSDLTVVLTVSLNGNAANLSLTLGAFLSSKNQYIGLVDKGSKNLKTFIFCSDFCQVPCQRTCASCTVGRYLSSSANDNLCLLPSEFPVKYGHDGTYMQPCLGSLTSGCTSCPTTYLTCAACDTASGFFFYPSDTSKCYQVATMPDTLGVNNGASPKVVTSCSDSNCLKCASDHTQCTQCKPSWYLKNPSTGACFQNNIPGWGIQTASPNGVIRQCSVANCGGCLAAYTACTSCQAGFYFKEGSTAACFANTVTGFGLKTVGPDTVLAACTTSNCKNCNPNYLVCTECAGAYLVDFSDKLCKLSVPRKGPDGAGYLRPCSDANCASCSTIYTNCLACDPGFDPSAGSCAVSTTPFGPDILNSGTLTPCTVINCQSCAASHLVCDSCKPMYYFPEGSTATCILNDQDFFGLKPAGLGSVVAPCQVNSCESCLTDYSRCLVCSGTKYPVSPALTVCQENTTPGLGLTTLPGGALALQGCTDANCLHCFSDSTVCTECKPTNYKKLGQESLNPGCFKNDISGFGLTTTAPQKLAACSVPSCTACFSDHTKCEICQTGLFPLESDPTQCLPNTQPQKGLKTTSTGTVLADCLISGCSECFANYSSCLVCSGSQLYDPAAKQCTGNNFPGKGASTQTDGSVLLLDCQVANCVDCYTDITKCKQCSGLLALDSTGSKCVVATTSNNNSSNKTDVSNQISFIEPIYFVRSTSTFKVQFFGNIDDIPNINEKFIVELRDSASGELVSTDRYSVALTKESSFELLGVIVKADSSPEIPPSTLTLTQNRRVWPVVKNTTHMLPLEKPILVQEVVLVDGFGVTLSQAGVIGKAAGALLAISGALGVSAGAGGGPNQLSAMLKMVDSIDYVLHTNGVRVYRAESFIHFWSQDIMALLDNAFFIDERKLNCIPKQEFAREDVSCSFLNNYGSPLLTILILVGAYLLTMFLGFVAKSLKKRRYNKLARAVWIWNWIPAKIFTSELMVTLLDGSQIEIMRFAILNFYYINTTPGMIGAAIVSAIALVLYGWFFWKTLVLISSMVRDAINQSLSSPNISRDLSKRDNSILKARKVGDSIANPAGENNAELGEGDEAKGQDECGNDPIKTEVFQGFKFFQPGESRLYLYIPLMFLGKSASMQLWVVLTPSFGIYQFWGILFFEAVYLAAVVILRPFRTLRPFIWMTASSTILTLIAIVNLVLNYHGDDLDFLTREKYYGSILIWLYGGTIACAFLPGILDLGISMVYLVKKCLQKKNKVTDGKAEQTTKPIAPPSLQHIEFKKPTGKVTGLTIGTKTTNLIQSGAEIEHLKPQAKVNRISIVDNSASKKLSKMKRFTPNSGFQALAPLKRNNGLGLGSQESNRILPINNSSRVLPNLRVRDSVQLGTLPQPVSTRDFQGPLISSPRNPVRALISPKNLESQSLKVGKPKPKIFAFGQTTKLKLVRDTPSMQNLIKPSSPGRGGSDELIKESSPPKFIQPASHQNSLPESLNNTKTQSMGLQHWKSQKE